MMAQMTPSIVGTGTTRQGAVETVRRMRVCFGVIDPIIRCSRTAGYAGLPYCKEHAYDALASLRNETLAEAATERHKARMTAITAREDRQEQREERSYWISRDLIDVVNRSTGVVYYLLVGKLIKIGWSSDLRQRLKSYPPDSKLLAVHPGTRETEKQMHQKFAHLLDKGREWFQDHEAIRGHAKAVVDEYGEPKLDRKKPAPRGAKTANRIR